MKRTCPALLLTVGHAAVSPALADEPPAGEPLAPTAPAAAPQGSAAPPPPAAWA